jgi:hypothetical protein
MSRPPGPPPFPPPAPADRGWRRKTLEELMAEQGIHGPQDLDSLAAPDLWEDDEEFERFLSALRESRRDGR